jgi:TPR repeat protein
MTSVAHIERTWVPSFRELRRTKNFAAAVRVLEGPRRCNDLLAELEFALLGKDAGLDFENVGRIVDRVHDIAPDADREVHFALYRAYERLLGLCTPEERYSRAFQHLVLTATHSDDPADSYAVAMNYESGRPTVAPDPKRAIEWYERAGRLGHPEATIAISRVRRSRLNAI